MIVCIGLFSIRTNQPEAQKCLFISCYTGRQEINIIVNKKIKTKLNMHNSIGDVALINISREINYSMNNFVQSPKQKFFAFPQPQDALKFCFFGHFPASCSYKKGSYKKMYYFELYVAVCLRIKFSNACQLNLKSTYANLSH